MKEDLGKTSCGMEANIAAALSYLVGWVTGLVFYLIEKENKFVRFHAMQSIIVFAFLNVLYIILTSIPFLGVVLLLPLGLLSFVLWLLLIIKAANGERFKLSVAGDIADKNS